MSDLGGLRAALYRCTSCGMERTIVSKSSDRRAACPSCLGGMVQCSHSAEVEPKEDEQINRPSHYITPSGLEAVDVVEAFEKLRSNFHRGTAAYYLLRAGMKGGEKEELQDLMKAQRWLSREVNRLQGKKEW